MKKIHAFLIAFSFLTILSCSIDKSREHSSNKIQLIKKKDKKEKINLGERQKKGIEYILEYQEQIRKPIGAKQATYKKGYLQEELKKVKLRKRLKTNNLKSINAVFKERGPANVPGRTRGIVVDPNNNKRWFLGTAGGGVWLTENDGISWTNLTDNQIAHLATTTIVISKQNSNILYVGTGEPLGATPAAGTIGGGGVFKTTNGGATWTSLSSTLALGDVARMIINPNDHNNVLIGTTSGIYRTTDGGSSWIKVYTSSDTVQDLDADPSNFNIQYASVNNVGLVKSINGGSTWATVFDTSTINANHVRFETTVSSVNTSVVFTCAYSRSGGTVSPGTDLYISKNGGTSFTNLTATSGAIVDRLDLVGGQGWYDNIVLAHPFNQNVFYVGGVELFKVTVNSDDTFTATEMAATNQNSNLNQLNTNVHVDQHGMYAIKGTGSQFKILLANDGGITSSNMSIDPGINEGDWTNAVTGKNSTQFYGATKQNGVNNYIAGAQDNGSWVSLDNNSDKAKNYISILGGDGFEAVWHYNKPGSFIVASQTYGLIGRYENFQGALVSFEDAGDGDISPFYSKLSNADSSPDVVFAISSNGVWRSPDFGSNWSLAPIPSNFTPSASSSLNVEPSIANPNIVWAGAAMTESGAFVLHVSQDNGQSFSAVAAYDNLTGSHNYFISGIGVSPTEEKRAYALFSGQGAAKILKTEDLGQTWTDISGYAGGGQTGFPDVGVNSLIEMPFDKNTIWAGTDIGIFETLNGGATWNPVQGFIPVAAYDMRIVNDQVVIATHGRGIWSATITELSSYTPPAYLAFSTVSASQKAVESSKATVSYNVTSDDVGRVKIFVDDVEQAEVVQDFSTGVNYTFDTGDLSEGNHKIGVQLFDDANNLQTPISNSEFTVINFKEPSTLLKITEFSNDNFFAFNGTFKVDDLAGSVSGLVLNNSDHPYKDNTTYAAMLRQPLVLSASNDSFEIVDAAIIEPFTDDLNDLESFYDYVIIEGSTDLKNWKTIDKYDARRYPEWLTEYNKEESANIVDDLFKRQSISLSSKGFTAGETIVFRLSLVTDPGTTSYGWAIKSVNDNAVASVNEVIDGKRIFTIYPTISNGNFTIFAKNTLGKSKLQIVDVTGKSVYNDILDFNSSEKHELSVNLNSGIYILQIIDENNKLSHEKIIIE